MLKGNVFRGLVAVVGDELFNDVVDAYLLTGENQLGLLYAVGKQPGGTDSAGRVSNGHLLDGGVGHVHHQGLDLERLETVSWLCQLKLCVCVYDNKE